MQILVVGLGNPGRRYKDTPHNVGFEFADALRNICIESGFSISPWELSGKNFSQVAKGSMGETTITFAKPLTFMNLSGRAVKRLCERSFDEVIIAHDDLDIPLGKYKIQRGKSPKQHNGILSIEQAIDAKKFIRIRIGVDARKDKSIKGERYVLMKYSPEQVTLAQGIIEQATQELYSLITDQKLSNL